MRDSKAAEEERDPSGWNSECLQFTKCLKQFTFISILCVWMFMDVLSGCMSVHHVPLKGKEGGRFPGSAASDSCESPYG